MRKGIWAIPGDLFFTRGHSGLAAAIRWAERTKGEEPTWANHVGVVTGAGIMLDGFYTQGCNNCEERKGRAKVVESLWKTEEWEWLTQHENDPTYEVSVWRYGAMTARQREVIVARARMFVGNSYGWWKLFTHLIDNRAFGGRVVTRRALSVDSKPICSYTAASSFAAAGIKTGNIPARAQSPDSMWDYVNESSLWYEVGRGPVKEVV